MAENDRDERLEKSIAAMRAASRTFYAQAVMVGNHPFIEFAGLMNEYIDACETAWMRGIDFTACHGHSGQNLPMESYMVRYVNEKLECIYGGRVKMVQVEQENVPA